MLIMNRNSLLQQDNDRKDGKKLISFFKYCLRKIKWEAKAKQSSSSEFLLMIYSSILEKKTQTNVRRKQSSPEVLLQNSFATRIAGD